MKYFNRTRRYNTCVMMCICVMILSLACNKSSFLEANPNEKLVIPQTLKDFRLLLENNPIMNGFGIGLTPGVIEAASDDYYLNESLFVNSSYYANPIYNDMYTWQGDAFSDPNKRPEDWGFQYRCISYANIILTGLDKITPTLDQLGEYNDIKGSALFFRAYMFYNLMQVFAPQYTNGESSTDLGVPLRLSSDIAEIYPRAKASEVYKQIILDLNSAEELLPATQDFNTRPSKAAVFGLLARIYLSINEFELALSNAEKCLAIRHELIDYNTISDNVFFPFNRSNSEIVFYSIMNFSSLELLNYQFSRVDSILFYSYSENDLRRKLFFKDAKSALGLNNDLGYVYRGSYDGSEKRFSGIATDEVLLIRAECYVRLGNIDGGIADLNELLKKRWSNQATFEPIQSSEINEALDIILQERRKELLMRGIRWLDLRRLNKEGRAITPQRVFSGKEYFLNADSPYYTFLIPADVIGFNPGMPQNPR